MSSRLHAFSFTCNARRLLCASAAKIAAGFEDQSQHLANNHKERFF